MHRALCALRASMAYVIEGVYYYMQVIPDKTHPPTHPPYLCTIPQPPTYTTGGCD